MRQVMHLSHVQTAGLRPATPRTILKLARPGLVQPAVSDKNAPGRLGVELGIVPVWRHYFTAPVRGVCSECSVTALPWWPCICDSRSAVVTRSHEVLRPREMPGWTAGLVDGDGELLLSQGAWAIVYLCLLLIVPLDSIHRHARRGPEREKLLVADCHSSCVCLRIRYPTRRSLRRSRCCLALVPRPGRSKTQHLDPQALSDLVPMDIGSGAMLGGCSHVSWWSHRRLHFVNDHVRRRALSA